VITLMAVGDHFYHLLPPFLRVFRYYTTLLILGLHHFPHRPTPGVHTTTEVAAMEATALTCYRGDHLAGWVRCLRATACHRMPMGTPPLPPHRHRHHAG